MDEDNSAFFDGSPNELLAVTRGEVSDHDWDAGLVAVPRPVHWNWIKPYVMEGCGQARVPRAEFEHDFSWAKGCCWMRQLWTLRGRLWA